MFMSEPKPDLTLAKAKTKTSQSQFRNVSCGETSVPSRSVSRKYLANAVVHERYDNMQRQGLAPRAIKMRAGQMNCTIALN